MPYNTGPFAPRAVRAAAEKHGLEPTHITTLAEEAAGIDDVLVAMLAVNEIAHFLPEVLDGMRVTPLIYPGVFDTDTDEMFERAVYEWDFSRTTTWLIAGHHAEAGNRPKLTSDLIQVRLNEILGNELVRVYSQVDADNTPDQATWVADMVEKLELEAVALLAPSFHLPRAYLTQLATLRKRGLDRKVVFLPWKQPSNPFQGRPLTAPWEGEVWSNAGLLPGEAKRIFDYSQKGDVASLSELKEYVVWLMTESPAASVLRQFNM